MLYRNNGDGTFTDVTKEAGLLHDGNALGLRLHLPRLRPRRPPGSVCGQLPGLPHRRDSQAGQQLELQLERHSGELRPARPAARRAAALYHNNGDGTFTDVSETSGIAKAQGQLRDDRRGRGFRQRRLAGHLRGLRFHAQLSAAQQSRRHLHGHRPGKRRGAERRRQGAGRHGRRHRRLQPGWQPGYLQDALRRRHQHPLSQQRQGQFRGRDHHQRPGRGDALHRMGQRASWTWTTTGIRICSS